MSKFSITTVPLSNDDMAKLKKERGRFWMIATPVLLICYALASHILINHEEGELAAAILIICPTVLVIVMGVIGTLDLLAGKKEIIRSTISSKEETITPNLNTSKQEIHRYFLHIGPKRVKVTKEVYQKYNTGDSVELEALTQTTRILSIQRVKSPDIREQARIVIKQVIVPFSQEDEKSFREIYTDRLHKLTVQWFGWGLAGLVFGIAILNAEAFSDPRLRDSRMIISDAGIIILVLSGCSIMVHRKMAPLRRDRDLKQKILHTVAVEDRTTTNEWRSEGLLEQGPPQKSLFFIKAGGQTIPVSKKFYESVATGDILRIYRCLHSEALLTMEKA